jgi:hypothetical protein
MHTQGIKNDLILGQHLQTFSQLSKENSGCNVIPLTK